MVSNKEKENLKEENKVAKEEQVCKKILLDETIVGISQILN